MRLLFARKIYGFQMVVCRGDGDGADEDLRLDGSWWDIVVGEG